MDPAAAAPETIEVEVVYVDEETLVEMMTTSPDRAIRSIAYEILAARERAESPADDDEVERDPDVEPDYDADVRFAEPAATEHSWNL